MSGNDYIIGKDIGRLQSQVAALQSDCHCGSSNHTKRQLSEHEQALQAKLCEVSSEIRGEFNRVIEKFGLGLQIAEFGLVANGNTMSTESICACCPGLGSGNASYRCCFVLGCDPCNVSISLPDHEEGPGPG
ncbi:hypothetical protein [Shewanella salipaludis]|uniref:Uncharacterized protein n=1 Tax=Shewanella salipaludis TaxID=2723052 RepID=A0A972JNE6_9GAMM|nr:hypothetical protein [Shewanella salipaludis]NMH66096.1 hypothetical protein [Shewanella salipaludis]